LVSHWEVETNSAVALMTGTFAALAANPQLSHGEALRQSMLAMINHPQQPNLIEPKYWAPSSSTVNRQSRRPKRDSRPYALISSEPVVTTLPCAFSLHCISLLVALGVFRCGA
jgi:hypothetical protein